MVAPGPDGLSSKACIMAYAQMDIRHPERVRINSRGSAGSKRNGNSPFQERGGQSPKYKGEFPVPQVNAESGTVGDGARAQLILLHAKWRLRLRNPSEVLRCARAEVQS